MTIVLIVFLAVVGTLWLSIFGYLLLIAALATRRRTQPPELSSHPEIAVLVPTFNEERLIRAKLEDLRRTNYPRERMAIVVVDGGSTDGTETIVRGQVEDGEAIQLISVPDSRGQADQLGRALAQLTQSIVVITDADATLEPGCIHELVKVLAHDRQTAVVGAHVQPATNLLEERLYWRLLNRLWWLEGEALGSALVSGVCYAIRRDAVAPNCRGVRAFDIHVAMAAAAAGLRARLCPAARATEVRTPRALRDFVQVRRRRGLGYLTELWSLRARPGAGLRWRVAHGVRLWHFLLTPALAAIAAASGAILLATPYWRWPAAVLAATIASLLLTGGASRPVTSPARWLRISLAAARLPGLIWLALVAINRSPAVRPAAGE